MPKPISVLFVASESTPFVKQGALGDIAHSLSMSIRDAGIDIRIMLPRYGIISERKNHIHEINRLKNIDIPIGNTTVPATIKSSSMHNPRTKVQAYITTNDPYLSEKKGIYRDVKTGLDFPDNAERFMFFAQSVIHTCLTLEWYPDVIHLLGWHGAFVPAFAKEFHSKKFKNTKFVLTINNIKDQGEFENKWFEKSALDKSILANYKHKNKLNFLRGAIHYADYVTTTSPSYAKQLMTDKTYTDGFTSYIRDKDARFAGIPCGVDPFDWNPRRDIFLPFRYEDSLEDFKFNNKVSLLNKVGLEFKPKTPVYGIVAQIENFDGMDLLMESLKEMMKHDVQVVLFGQGDPEIKKELMKLTKTYKNKFKFKFGFDEILAHQVYAGSDFYLNLSKQVPTALSFLYSLAYGCVPIAYNIGAIKDFGIPIDLEEETGNSLLFDEYNSNAFLDVFTKSVELFANNDLFRSFSDSNLHKDHAWTNSGKSYANIYKTIIKD